MCFSWRKEEGKKAFVNLARSWHNKHDGLIRSSVDPHAPYTVDPNYMQQLKIAQESLNEKYGSEDASIIWHIYVAETSDETVKTQEAFKPQLRGGIMEYLNSLGVLEKTMIAAHCVSLTGKDIAIIKDKNVKTSHNPISNLKLASGISPVPKMVEKGITVSLGTDSPCSNNTADMFEVMKVAALLHNGVNNNPTLMPAERVLEMATLGGAKALSWESEIGSIEVGKKADLTIVNFRKPHLKPLYNEASHRVYVAKASDVDTVIINGRIMIENRKLATLNCNRITREVEKAKDNLFDKLNANVK